jgi:hypothetical protein
MLYIEESQGFLVNAEIAEMSSEILLIGRRRLKKVTPASDQDFISAILIFEWLSGLIHHFFASLDICMIAVSSVDIFYSQTIII